MNPFSSKPTGVRLSHAHETLSLDRRHNQEIRTACSLVDQSTPRRRPTAQDQAFQYLKRAAN